MAEMKHIVVALGILGILSIVLQAIGCFVPAWMIVSVGIDTSELATASGSHTNMHFDIHMGLWTMSACVDGLSLSKRMHAETGDKCASVSTKDLEEKIFRQSTTNPATQKLLGNWLILQLLVVGAAVSAIVGQIFLFTFGRAAEGKVIFPCGFAAFSWFVSAALVLAAVGKQGSEIHTYSVGADALNNQHAGFSLKFDLPWALIPSGIGGVWAAFLATGMTVYMLGRDRRESPGVWRQFGEGKPV